ncbi:chemotaxis protein CheX [Alkalihalobacillus sp. LMS39]|uniref:chemotaxis protein CheX n=1 Tax=Alkalihalobacillus sp. LMS39 TaxID=2924032 RepID=UPI001FB3C8AB|nr:chemotaxis protein CheX [Alkalihalobacillus sp. LMS39]UOE93260.1 chemotaxis protein CheX [Alkalihalobacillus sp. LMS39]
MDARHVNAITKATKSILSSHLGLEVKLLNPFVQKKLVPTNDVTVILGIFGQLEGQLICTMEETTAKSIISTMMGGFPVEAIDEMGWSAIQEFGNWVAGNTATELSQDYEIDVTPPVVNNGTSTFHSTSSFITLPLESQIGQIDIHVTIKEK